MLQPSGGGYLQPDWYGGEPRRPCVSVTHTKKKKWSLSMKHWRNAVRKTPCFTKMKWIFTSKGVLFELIAHRYECGSLVITSNHPFSTWGSIIVDETMEVAAADRLIHHGYTFELKGESYRKKPAKEVTCAA